jgi:hypothetical protein
MGRVPSELGGIDTPNLRALTGVRPLATKRTKRLLQALGLGETYAVSLIFRYYKHETRGLMYACGV